MERNLKRELKGAKASIDRDHQEVKAVRDREPHTCSTPKKRYRARPTEEKETKRLRKTVQKCTPNPRPLGSPAPRPISTLHKARRGQTGMRRKKRQKEGRGRREEERQTSKVEGLERTEEGAVRNKNPWTCLNSEKVRCIGHQYQPHLRGRTTREPVKPKDGDRWKP